jgi:carbon-monoxide dehydrogenase medium subunit
VKLVAAAGYIPTSFRTVSRFGLVRARTIAEAVAAIADARAPAVLAGGTDLPARFNEGFAPSDLVDVSRVGALREIKVVDDTLEIGALVTHDAGSSHALITQHLPSFGAAWRRIANVRVRLSATIGGNLMARRTRYEGAILLSALSARLRFESKTGVREIAVESNWSTDADRGGLLTTIVIPLRRGLRMDYARDLRPIMTQAVVIEDYAPGRVVTATEFIVPRIRRLKDDKAEGSLECGDPVTSDTYLRKVSETLLVRQLERVRRQ